jgi:hypothetical protein
MIFLVVLVVTVTLLALFPGSDKPTELDADVWVSDPEERARRLSAKKAAWREGRAYFSPDAVAKIEVDCAAVQARHWTPLDFRVANPNVDQPAERLVRRHPMRPPRWE